MSVDIEAGALKTEIFRAMREVAELNDVELGPEMSQEAPPMDLALLETGLDSIGFATVVALLEDRVGFDPFLMSDEPVYPTTLGEFVAVYQSAVSAASSATPA